MLLGRGSPDPPREGASAGRPPLRYPSGKVPGGPGIPTHESRLSRPRQVGPGLAGRNRAGGMAPVVTGRSAAADPASSHGQRRPGLLRSSIMRMRGPNRSPLPAPACSPRTRRPDRPRWSPSCAGGHPAEAGPTDSAGGAPVHHVGEDVGDDVRQRRFEHGRPGGQRRLPDPIPILLLDAGHPARRAHGGAERGERGVGEL